MDGLERYVLVCTDCLSEGINLQQYFDAVVHYDLAWNPTRHEQREGRVDRFGQVKPEIKVVTYYGVDNQIDALVLKVLIAKHETIRKDLGISIPVPTTSNAVLEALYEGLLLKKRDTQQLLLFEDDDLKTKVEELDQEWKSAADREKRSRALFAQHRFDDRSVAEEVQAVRSAIGSATDVEQFVTTAVRGYRGTATKRRGSLLLDLRETPAAVRETAGGKDEIRARFELPVSEGEVYLSRTHPLVEGLASYAMESALDPVLADGSRRVLAARCGAIRTKAVQTRTTVLLVRFRYHILTTIGEVTRPLLAEDCQVVAFSGVPATPAWLSREAAESLLQAEPDENVSDDVARSFVRKVLDNLGPIQGRLDVTGLRAGQGAARRPQAGPPGHPAPGNERNHRAATAGRHPGPLCVPASGVRSELIMPFRGTRTFSTTPDRARASGRMPLGTGLSQAPAEAKVRSANDISQCPIGIVAANGAKHISPGHRSGDRYAPKGAEYNSPGRQPRDFTDDATTKPLQSPGRATVTIRCHTNVS